MAEDENQQPEQTPEEPSEGGQPDEGNGGEAAPEAAPEQKPEESSE